MADKQIPPAPPGIPQAPVTPAAAAPTVDAPSPAAAELRAIETLLDEAGAPKELIINDVTTVWTPAQRVANFIYGADEDHAAGITYKERYEEALAILERIVPACVLEDGFMTPAVGQRLLAFGAEAEALLKKHKGA